MPDPDKQIPPVLLLSEESVVVQVEQVDGLESGLMQEAQRFFVLTQTDNLWKEHLQVSCTCLTLVAHQDVC